MITRKDLSGVEFSAFYAGYINLIAPDKSITEALKAGKKEIIDLFKNVPTHILKKSYAPGKWTILEVLQHLTDIERIFSYRALCIARGDKTPLPGFDQNNYVTCGNATRRGLKSLLYEYEMVRNATIAFFEGIDHNALQELGIVSGNPISAQAIGFILAGHEQHHKIIIATRYLNG